MKDNNEIISIEEQIEDSFKIELNKLNKLYNELEELDEETKDHFEEVKNSMAGRNTLSFIHLQTGNLVNIKTTKMNIIKEKINLKSKKFDLLNKIKDKNNEAGGSLQDQIESIYKVIKEDIENSSDIEEVEANSIKKTNKGDIINKRMKEILEEDPDFLSDNEKNLRYASRNILIKVKKFVSKKTKEKKWRFVAVDIDTDEMIPDYILPNKNNYEMRFIKIDNVLKAVDQNDQIYEIYQ